MARELVWVEKERFQGWVCSACGWEFKSPGPLVGRTIEEMKCAYERQRDEGFKAHDCAQHPKSAAKS
jgi:hypothetical protein